MAYPASEIPTYSSFRVHGFGGGESLRHAVRVSSALLESLRIPVHGPSGREAPTPYFWKATLALVSSEGTEELERVVPDLEDRDPLLMGLAASSSPVLKTLGTQTPDIWCVAAENRESLEEVAEAWMEQGVGAVVVFHPSGICAWKSCNAAFGHSQGSSQRDIFSGDPVAVFGNFAGGLIYALLEELMSDNLFNKPSVRIERECLEMRPLHLSRAVETGLAAAAVCTGDDENILNKRGTALGLLRDRLRLWRGPVAQSWGGRGR
ncbi:MAG TPA: hypothetical protein DCQ83_08565 [Fibrobacteres bacterium]|nr:hypothetical protein [Fibrobacterota bacterium]